ncbi:hypothetical protein [Salinibacterium sp. ZJ77]|uniref:hypothetical protein n=1 Tax=Salinibacterium sp. ZJ77 TaxID=2708337 RepID=UPI00141EE443|nr:hypothetical protein [Salinibacterium sp. ZJ77]
MSVGAVQRFRSRLSRGIAIVTVVAVGVTTLGACVPGTDADLGPGRDLRLYSGPIPAPAPLTASGMSALPEAPTPPSDFGDAAAMAEYQRAVEEYMAAIEGLDPASGGDFVEFAKQVGELVEDTRASDEASVAAWQSLLVAAGIAVGYGDEAVSVSGMEGSGIPMTSAELRLHALVGASSLSVPLSEVAGVVSATGVFGDADLTQALYDDLLAESSSAFGTIFTTLNPDVWGMTHRGEFVWTPPEEVRLTGAQVALVVRRLSADLLAVAEANGILSIAGTTRSSAGESPTLAIERASTSVRAADPGSACGIEIPPWAVDARKQAHKATGVGFGKVLTYALDWYNVNGSLRLGAAAVAGLAVFGALMAKMAMLQARFSIDNAPLVRTKDRTAGERRELTIAYAFPEGTGAEVVNCFSLLLAPYGIDVADITSGPASGIDVDLKLQSTRLEYGQGSRGTDTYRKQTDDKGVVVFPIQGAAQRERLPSGAEPEDVVSRVRSDANIEGSDLMKDLLSIGWDVVAPGLAGILANIAARMKLISFEWSVPVRDWTMSAEFDMVLTGDLWTHTGTNRGGRSDAPCGVWVQHMSTTASGTVESQKPHRVLVEYLAEDGEGTPIGAVLMHTRGMTESQLHVIDGAMQVAHFQADYALTKSEASPGVDPMPDHFEEPGIGGCGDGRGDGYTPQPDCGPRDLLGVVSVNVRDGVYFLTADDVHGSGWNDCGWSSFPRDPVAPPERLSACADADVGGGEMPSIDSIFNPRGWFEVSGTLECRRDGDGTLERFTFDWTLKFCRVTDGASTGCET